MAESRDGNVTISVLGPKQSGTEMVIGLLQKVHNSKVNVIGLRPSKYYS